MRRRHVLVAAAILALVSIVGAPSTFAQDEISIVVSLDRDTIGMDEQAVMRITLSGAVRDLPSPQLPTLPTFEVASQGRSSSVQIINGQISSEVTYRYLLYPQKSGVFPITNIAVVHQNRRYRGNDVQVTVLDKGTSTPPELENRAQDSQGNTRDYFLEAAVDNTTPFVGEQITLTLKFYIAVQYFGSPELLEPTTVGFWAEVLGNSAPYFQQLNGRQYKVIERKYALFPTKTGELSIGQSKINVNVAVRNRSGRDPFDAFGNFFGRGEEVSVRSEGIRVNVKPLPQAGRPTDFTGTVGRFTIGASVNKNETEVNQPVTLRVSINGTGNIKSVAEPFIPELDDFRVYRASSSENVSKVNDQIGGSKIFEEVFIPKRPGSLTIPSLSYTYFDPDQRAYRTVESAPVTITVVKPEGYVATPETPYAGVGMTIGAEGEEIRFIKSDLGETQAAGRLVLVSPLYLVVNGLPVLVLVGTLAARYRRQRLAGDTRLARSRSASRLARKRLAKARTLATVDSASEFYAEIYQALTSFIADKLDISPHGLTTERVRELLDRSSADQEVIESAVNLMRHCDFARFAPSRVTAEEIQQSLQLAESIMVRLEGLHFA